MQITYNGSVINSFDVINAAYSALLDVPLLDNNIYRIS